MTRTVLVVLLAAVFVIPANAKSNRDVYPISCDELWTAVKDTLENPRDYGVLSADDLNQRASFVVVGNLVMYTDRIALTAQDRGCKLKLTMLQIGADNSDERGFLKRLKRSLARLQAAKPSTEDAPKPSALLGQQ